MVLEKRPSIHSLCGLLPIDSGEISIFGQKQSIHSSNIRRAIGLVTQEITVCNDLTVVENFRYFGSLYGLKRGCIKELQKCWRLLA